MKPITKLSAIVIIFIVQIKYIHDCTFRLIHERDSGIYIHTYTGIGEKFEIHKWLK